MRCRWNRFVCLILAYKVTDNKHFKNQTVKLVRALPQHPFFHQESERLQEIFTRLHYPEPLIQNTIKFFVEMKVTGTKRPPQQAGEINKLREQLTDLSRKTKYHLKYIPSLQVTRSKMSLKLKNLNLQLSTSKTLYISLSVICVMQIIYCMLAIQADTYITLWRNIKDQQSATTLENNVETNHVKSLRTLGC